MSRATSARPAPRLHLKKHQARLHNRPKQALEWAWVVDRAGGWAEAWDAGKAEAEVWAEVAEEAAAAGDESGTMAMVLRSGLATRGLKT